MSTNSQAAARDGDSDTASPISVVIVDDHLLVADSVAATLDAAADVRVVAVAGSCAEGLAQTRLHQPDVLLLDQRLPDGLGTDYLPSIREASPQTRVIIVTAADTSEVLLRAIDGGCAGLVAKGKRASTLLDAVRRAAKGETVVSARDLQRLMTRLVHPQAQLGDDITAREREVLVLLTNGHTTTWLAHELVISPATARNHIQSLISKLGAHSKLEAVSIALREGIVESP